MNRSRALLGLIVLGMAVLVTAAAVVGAGAGMRWQIIGSGGGPVQGAQHGLASAIGQPVSGRVSNGYTLYSGLYLGAAGPSAGRYQVMLPAVLSNPCVGMPSSQETEPNDQPVTANGQLCPNVIYGGSPDSHGSAQDDDWFYFNWSGQGSIAIELDSFLAKGQLLLYLDPEGSYLDRDYDRSNGRYSINYTGTGQSGTYYIRVFAPESHPTGNGDYTLTYK